MDPDQILNSLYEEYDVIEDSAVKTTACTSPGIPKTCNLDSPKPLWDRPAPQRLRKISPVSLTRVDCQEKLIICLDISAEVRDKHNHCDILEKVVEVLLKGKHRINQCHEFALIILQETAAWITGFTNKLDEIVLNVKNAQNDLNKHETASITSIFELLNEKLNLPMSSLDSLSCPEHVVRTILVYSRSTCIPDIDTENLAFKKLMNSPNFFFDLLYLHSDLDPEKSQAVYNKLITMNIPRSSYVFALPFKKCNGIYKAVATLLAHPLRRPLQHEFKYEMNSFQKQ
ncbi:BRISC and BRCA1-A complex member 1 [Nymphon striatum]|nr:BRISC and BRCA1-A complex member 1 [Nymphon striatum]